MTTGVTCPRCGLMQIVRVTCKACGAVLGIGPEPAVNTPPVERGTSSASSLPRQSGDARGARGQHIRFTWILERAQKRARGEMKPSQDYPPRAKMDP
jgi:hypothetical protein